MHGARRRDERCRSGPAAAGQRLAIEPRTATLPGVIQFIARRGIDDAGHRHPILDNGQTDRPVVFAPEEGTRAVDWIDDEDPLAIETAGIVDGFLAEPAVVRTRLQEVGGKKTVHNDIGLADRRGVFLGPALYIAPEVAGRDDTRRHRGGAEQFEVIVIGWGVSRHCAGLLGPARALDKGAPARVKNGRVNGVARDAVNRF